MGRLRAFAAFAAAAAAAGTLAACSGGGGSRAASPAVPAVPAATAAPAGKLVDTTLTLAIPNAAANAAAASTKRMPEYISSGTAGASIHLLNPPNGYTQPGTIVLPLGGSNATASCPPSAQGYTCIILLPLPPGTDAIVVQTLDGSMNVLSSQMKTFIVNVGQPNTLSLTLDAQVASAGCPSPSIAIGTLPSGATGAQCSGGSASTITLSGNGPFTFPLSLLDDARKTIAPTVPGAPVISATPSNDAFKATVTQNPYALVLTPSNTTTSGSVTVSAAGASSGDGVGAASATIAFALAPRMNTGIVSTVAGNGTAGTANGPAASAEFNGLESIAVASNGTLYIADTNANLIRKVSGGTVSTFAGNGTAGHVDSANPLSAEFAAPSGITIDPSGNVFVADAGSYVREITPQGVVSTFAGGGPGTFTNGTGTGASFSGAYDVKSDRSGNLYVADSNNDAIRKITPQAVVTTFAGNGTGGMANGTGTAATFSSPEGVGVDPNGNVFVADYGNNAVREITPAGVVTTVAGGGTPGAYVNGPATSAKFNEPTGVIADVFGNVFVADYGNNAIRKITSGTVSTLAGSATGAPGSANGAGTAASFSGPVDVAVDANDDVFVADSKNNLIREIH